MDAHSSVLGTPRPDSTYRRLGELREDGWQVAIVGRPDGKDGVVVSARRGSRLVEETGATVADVALSLFERCRQALPDQERAGEPR